MEGKFIRIGNRVINTALVSDMTIEEDGSISVHLAAPAKDGARIRSFRGDEATILLAWIERNAVDASKVVVDVEPPKKPRGADLVAFV